MPAKKTATKKSATSKKTSAKRKKAASPKARKSSAKTKSTKTGDKEVTIDRRRKADRRDENSEEAANPSQPSLERREKVQRRRQIDPTTCERDYSVEEVEFMSALDEYKRTSGRMFPTCSEVLEVIRELGYVKLTKSELALYRAEGSQENAESSFDSESPEAENGSEEPSEAEDLAVNGWTI